MNGDLPAAARRARLADGCLATQLLYAAVAVAVLRTCRAAMAPDAVLAVVEAVLPERAVADPAAVRMDLHMLVLLRGRERTVAEFTTLFDAAGLRLTADVPTPAGVHVLEARAR